MPLTFGELFAGIGGIGLGLERAGMACKWHCEIDDYATRVLTKHWPNVPKWGDVQTFPPPGDWSVDVICGGFPCQGVSNAGHRKGLEDDRSGLWSEYARIVRVLRPRYVLVENVAALLVRGIDRVLGDLAACGYDAEWDCFPAAAFGAHHLRDLVFIVANRPDAVCVRLQGERPTTQESWSEEQFAGLVQAELRLSVPTGSAGGISRRVPHRAHRLRCLGNSVVPQVAEYIGRRIVAAHGDQPCGN